MRNVLALLLALVAALATACGGDDDLDLTTLSPTPTSVPVTGTPAPTPSPTLPVLAPTDPTVLPMAAPSETPAPSVAPNPPGTLLEPGTYTTATFAPAMTFTVADGWRVTNETEHSVTLIRRPEPDNIVLTIDSANSEPVATAVSRFTSITGTTAGEVTDTTVAGFAAKEFDLEIDAVITPVNNLDQPYSTLQGDRLHFWIIDVNGTTVKVIAEASSGEFDYVLALVRETVAMMAFG